MRLLASVGEASEPLKVLEIAPVVGLVGSPLEMRHCAAIEFNKSSDIRRTPAVTRYKLIMQKVLVSGVSGYLGCHVARELLENGFCVVGTVRSEEKVKQVRESLAAYCRDPACLNFAVVPDIRAEHAFDDAVKDVDFVMHTASPFHFDVSDPKTDLIDPAVNGTLGMLISVDKYGSKVQRVVITSSAGAVQNYPEPSILPDGLSELDWNTGAVAMFQALKEKTPTMMAYRASKTLAEQSAWAFMKESKRRFDLAVINPSFIMGPVIQPCTSIASLATSAKIVADFYTFATKTVDPMVAIGCVDVRDVARAHFLAMTVPGASGQRFLVSSAPFTHQKLVSFLCKQYPGRQYASGNSVGVPLNTITAKSKEVLGMGEYISFEQMVVDTVESLKERSLVQ
ncbi:methylglyoxal reductase (NADPH-dependent) gre2 [Entophlyctis luteolus]|nr:methylglyoxal reductase (NADPH-dependent) gre2 [Entophlyctis luteolus]